MGDNQLGVEVHGTLLERSDALLRGAAQFESMATSACRTANSYTGFFTASQAFDAGKLGVQRIGVYAMVGEAPTYWLTQTGRRHLDSAGSGIGNKSFSREGFVGQFYFGQHVDLAGRNSAWLG